MQVSSFYVTGKEMEAGEASRILINLKLLFLFLQSPRVGELEFFAADIGKILRHRIVSDLWGGGSRLCGYCFQSPCRAKKPGDVQQYFFCRLHYQRGTVAVPAPLVKLSPLLGVAEERWGRVLVGYDSPVLISWYVRGGSPAARGQRLHPLKKQM